MSTEVAKAKQRLSALKEQYALASVSREVSCPELFIGSEPPGQQVSDPPRVTREKS